MAWLAFGMLTRELRDGEMVVGGGADANWRVSTADLMPRHFTVFVRGQEVSIHPYSAECVVVVNGGQLLGVPCVLRDGDVVYAGSGRFIFSDFTPRSAPLTPVEILSAFLVDDASRVAHPLSSRSVPIGRDASNAIVIRDPTASRFHAEIRREAGGFALHAMGSSGTVLNGATVSAPCLLKEGDTIEVAFTKLRFTERQLDASITLASPHSVENDEASRKPTLNTGRVMVTTDNEAGRESSRLRVAIGVLAILAIAFFVWRAVSRSP